MFPLERMNTGEQLKRDDRERKPIASLGEGRRVAIAHRFHDGRGWLMEGLIAVDIDEDDLRIGLVDQEIQLVEVDDQYFSVMKMTHTG